MEEQNRQIKISGIVRSVVYRNEANGYTVLRLETDDGALSVLVGFIPYAAPGERLEAVGKWTTHPAHGTQFKAESFERKMPENEAGTLEYLSSGVVAGIGPATARRIVGRFGTDAMEVLENEPHRLVDIKGITGVKAKQIGQNFRKQSGIRRLMEFLLGHGLMPQLAMRLYKRFGEASITAVRANPYILVDEFFGVDFHKADELALDMGFEGMSACRLEAALLYELTYNLNQGQSFIPREKLIEASAGLLGALGPDFEDWGPAIERALETLIESGQVARDTSGGHDACYLREVYEAECYVAERLGSMVNKRLLPPRGITAMVDEISKTVSLDYAPGQRRAVLMSARSRVMLLTGGPGTGKTTTVRAMLSLFNRMELKTALTAPTGRAAKRMSELCGQEATTIHRLLDMEYSGETNSFGFVHDEDNPIDYDAVIVDETSMIDIMLMRALLAALPCKCRLVLVGDPDQLPSVGPGNVLSDMLSSERIDTVRLTEIFRQAGQSNIIVSAHAVNNGRMPELHHKQGDFFFIRCDKPDQIPELLLDLYQNRLPKNRGIHPSKIQVLTPTRTKETGTVALNRLLRESINPPSSEKKEAVIGPFVFREGDKVMQVHNNYDIIWKKNDGSTGLGMFNGDIGTVVKIEPAASTLSVRFDDRVATYSFDMLNELEPAFAMTVHKAQGSEYDAVILVVSRSPSMLLNRRVLYTAITRARELMVIIGSEAILEQMISNNRINGRYSGLKDRLLEK